MTRLFLLKNQTFFISTLVLSFILATPIEGAESAHEHGVGTLSIAVEGHDVEIELTVPGSDVVGFEHIPSSESERQAVITDVEILRYVNGIVVLSPEAKCRVEDAEVASGLMEDKKDDHGGGHSMSMKRKARTITKRVIRNLLLIITSIVTIPNS